MTENNNNTSRHDNYAAPTRDFVNGKPTEITESDISFVKYARLLAEEINQTTPKPVPGWFFCHGTISYDSAIIKIKDRQHD